MELKDYLSILKRRFGWFLLTFLVGCGLYALAFISEPLSYEAKASLLIQIEMPDPLASTTSIPVRMPGISSATREQLLSGEEVFEIAVKIATAAKLSGSRVTTQEEAERILSERNSPLLTDRAYLGKAVRNMMNSVTIGRRNQAQIVDVVARSADPQEAISWANAHVLASEDMSRREVLSSYQTALADIHQNLERNASKQKDLQDKLDRMFESDVEPTIQLSGAETEIRRIRDDMRRLKAEITGIDYEIQRVQAGIHCRVGMVIGSGDAAFVSVEESAYDAKIAETEANLVAEETRLEPEHPEIKKLRAQLDHFKRKLPAQHTKLLTTKLDSLIGQRQQKELELSALKADLDERLVEMAKISERYSQYVPLKNDLELVSKDTTDLMVLKRRCELLISSARPYVQVRREATEATLAGRKMPGSMVFWMLSAFVVAVMVAYLREYLDTSISSEYDVRRHLNLPVFGIVPYLDGEKLTMRLEPNSSLGEMFNAAATLIRTALLEGGYNCIAVCSANPQEGKTTVSINLATAFARKGLRTLLIDGDMRRPEVHNLLKLDNSRGLSGVLDGRLKVMGLTPSDSTTEEERPMSFSQIFMGCEVENLYVLPSGPLPASSANLIEAARFEQLLSEARKAMDIVILDTPPICTVSDALTLATRVDANIFVVGAGMSEQRDVTWAKHLLSNVHARMLGVVLTMARKRARMEYYYYYYDSRKKVREQI